MEKLKAIVSTIPKATLFGWIGALTIYLVNRGFIGQAEADLIAGLIAVLGPTANVMTRYVPKKAEKSSKI